MSSKKEKNHYVQKARMRFFSSKKGNNYYTYVIDTGSDTIYHSDISDVFELEHFYPEKLENRLAKFESKSMEIFNQFLKGSEWTVERKDLNRLLRYVLIQLYRTPQKIDDFYSSLDKDPLQLIKTDLKQYELDFSKKGIKALSNIYLNEILEKDWNLLRKSKNMQIQTDVHILDRFWPFVVQSNQQFILNDNGLASEILVDFTVDRETIKNGLFNLYKQNFTDTQIDSEIAIRKWISFIFIPLTPNLAFVIADDIWRQILLNPHCSAKLHENGFESQFVETYGKVPTYMYSNPDLYPLSLCNSLDTLIDNYSNHDSIIIKMNDIPNNCAHYLNRITFNQKNKQCICYNPELLAQSIQSAKNTKESG